MCRCDLLDQRTLRPWPSKTDAYWKPTKGIPKRPRHSRPDCFVLKPYPIRLPQSDGSPRSLKLQHLLNDEVGQKVKSELTETMYVCVYIYICMMIDLRYIISTICKKWWFQPKEIIATHQLIRPSFYIFLKWSRIFKMFQGWWLRQIRGHNSVPLSITINSKSGCFNKNCPTLLANCFKIVENIFKSDHLRSKIQYMG